MLLEIYVDPLSRKNIGIVLREGGYGVMVEFDGTGVCLGD